MPSCQSRRFVRSVNDSTPSAAGQCAGCSAHTLGNPMTKDLLLLGTPEGVNWRPQKLKPPRAEDHDSSGHLWLALSDKRVVRGYASYCYNPMTHRWSFHSWVYYENAKGGLIPRDLSCNPKLKVEAWAEMVVPNHPLP